MSMRGTDGTVTGLNVDIVQAMGERCGCRVDWREMPWPRALTALSQGRIDIVPGAALTPERERSAFPLGPYGPARRIGIVARTDDQGQSLVPSTMAALLDRPDLRIGIIQGATYGPEFNKARQTLEARQQLEQARSFEQLYDMLRAGNIDGLIVDMTYFEQNIRQEKALDHIVDSGLTLAELRGHLLLSRLSPLAGWSTELNSCLRSLDGDGTIDKIIARWLP